jgi:O-acetyl-ADP-ribose deacetylase (regulator of RNase III)
MPPRRPSTPKQASRTATLPLEVYRERLGLDLPFTPPPPARITELSQIVDRLTDYLLAEHKSAPESLHRLNKAGTRPRGRLQALATIRRPRPPLPDEIHTLFDRLLQNERKRRRETAAASLPTIAEAFPNTRYPAAPQTSLWHGDITTLAVDAIVNAANEELLGCFSPFHPCVDNAIHSAAGPRLRADCDAIMQLQAGDEPVGAAKITRAYNLPSRFVLHTLGPVCPPRTETPSPEAAKLLARCYTSCLDLAAELPQIRSLAFCGISTGVFGFPPEPACDIALATVAAWLERNPQRFDRVIFTVFSEADWTLYSSRLA